MSDLNPKGGTFELPTGDVLSWEANEDGGRRYWINELEGAIVWDTRQFDSTDLLAALQMERSLELIEAARKQHPVVGS